VDLEGEDVYGRAAATPLAVFTLISRVVLAPYREVGVGRTGLLEKGGSRTRRSFIIQWDGRSKKVPFGGEKGVGWGGGREKFKGENLNRDSI